MKGDTNVHNTSIEEKYNSERIEKVFYINKNIYK